MNAKLILENNFIDSVSGAKIDIYSPWNGQVIGTVEAATSTEANSMIETAAKAFQSYRFTDLSFRLDLLMKAHAILKQRIEPLSELLTQEIAKSIDDARSEIVRSLEYLEITVEAVKFLKGKIYYGDMFTKYPRNRKTGYYQRAPLGVVLAISPFNYPINLSITKIAPALVMGNTVVFKPATAGSLTAFEFYKAFIEAGFPPGVFNFITGSSSVIGDPLLTHPQTALIAFTGSTNVGNHIKTVANGIPLLMELGGKDNAIVTAKADLDLAAKEIVSGAFSYNGQRCTAQKLVLVYESVAAELKTKILNLVQEVKTGPMINKEAADYVEELISDAKNKGAEVNLNGARQENTLAPCVLSNVNEQMRIFKEEQFGPVLPLVIVNDEQEAIAKANTSDFGLQASVYTNDLEEAYRIADKLEVGSVQINGRGDRGPDNFPFGGVKDSGQLMQGLEESLELMSRGKLIVMNLHKQQI